MERTKQATTELTKQCKNCKEVKPLTEFYKHPNYVGGYRHKCKKCVCEGAKVARKTIPQVKDKLGEFWNYNINPITGYRSTRYTDTQRLKANKNK